MNVAIGGSGRAARVRHFEVRRADDLRLPSARSAFLPRRMSHVSPIIQIAMAKSDEKKLYKIGDVCRVADVQPYVLRYWETEFPALAPGKSTGGQRVYTDREVN